MYDEIIDVIRKNNCEELLRQVYSVYGFNSTEFLFVIQGFLFWLIHKYVCLDMLSKEDVEELLSQCMCELLEKFSLQHYDSDLGKLSSYIHTVVRGEITKFLRRKQNIDAVSLVTDIDGGDYGSDIDVDRDVFMVGGSEDIDDMIVGIRNEVFAAGDVDTLLYRKILWDMFGKECVMEDEIDGNTSKQEIDVTERDGFVWIYTVNRDILLLLAISLLFKFDLSLLLYLYEKYDKDLWFFFFMLSGRRLVFPSVGLLYKLFKYVDKLYESLITSDGSNLDVSVKTSSKRLQYFTTVLQELLQNGVIAVRLGDSRFFNVGLRGLLGGDSFEFFVKSADTQVLPGEVGKLEMIDTGNVKEVISFVSEVVMNVVKSMRKKMKSGKERFILNDLKSFLPLFQEYVKLLIAVKQNFGDVIEDSEVDRFYDLLCDLSALSDDDVNEIRSLVRRKIAEKLKDSGKEG